MPLIYFAAEKTITETINQSQNIFKQAGDTFFNGRSILALLISLTIAIVLGRLIASALRWFTKIISHGADRSEDLKFVNRLRRVETLIILSIAIIRMLLIAMAIYFWWLFIHPEQKPTALIGASAVFAIILGGVLAPILRDFASGSVMMAEHWFGVGDLIKVEPFSDVQGVVERVTLRSTRIRGINGEIIWLNNQNITGVRITPKGIRTVALEIFVTDLRKGLELIEKANTRLPSGPLMVERPLSVMTTIEAGNNIWHITALGEAAPGREWLLDKYAIKVLQEIDENSKAQILLHEPIARYADSDAERRFARTIQNAQKTPRARRHTLKTRSHKPKISN